MSRILVPFHGAGEGVDELPWGQVALWHGMSLSGRSVTLPGVSPLPSNTTVEHMADLLGFMVGRHQALRTRLRFRDGGRPLQVCVTSGVVPLEVVDVADREDPAEVAEAVKARYRATVFDYEHEFPIRMAVIRRRGILTHMVAVYLHLALDAGGMAALLADIEARDPYTGAAAGPVTGMRPLEQAEHQRTPAARKKSVAAMAYLEQALRAMHPNQFGAPRYEGHGRVMLRYRSPAAALAAQRIAAEQGTTTSSALLAVYAATIARFTGVGVVMTWLSVSNRFRPGFADTVSAVAQLSPFVIDVDGLSLGEVVARTRTCVLNAYKHAYFDPYEQDPVIDRVEADRGPFDHSSCFFLDRRRRKDPTDGPVPTDNQIRALAGRGEHRWEHRPDMADRRLFLTVEDGPDAIDFVLVADTRFFSNTDMIALTTDLEHVAVRTAIEPKRPTGVGEQSTRRAG